MSKFDYFLVRFLVMFLAAWFFTTIVVDFVAVPNVFRTVTNLEEAGKVGIKVFTTYNFLELSFAFLAGFMFWKLPAQNKTLWIGRVLAVVLIFQVLFYILFLNPNIIEYSRQMHEIGIGNEGYEFVEDQHQFYHHLYVRMDGFKLFALLFLQILSLVSWRGRETGAKV